MIVRLLTRLRIVRGIWLEDFEGQIYYTWAKNRPGKSGQWAHIYPFTKVGAVALCDGGTVIQPHYIRSWGWL